MAEQGDTDLQFTQAEAGLAFKGEMLAMNILLGYWKQILGVIAAVLGSILIFGQYQNATLRAQRGVSAEIARALEDLPGELIQLPAILETGIGDISKEDVTKVATTLETIAAANKGTAKIEAYLKAAEIYRITGDTDRQRAALEQAAVEATGTLAYASVSALANLDLENGNSDAALERFKGLRDSSQGFLAQQAAMDLGLAQEHLGKKAEAKQTYADFLMKWPDSSHNEVVQDRLNMLAGDDG